MHGVRGGARTFYCLGTLGIDEVWSPAQALLDFDIVAHAAPIAAGLVPAPELDLAVLPDVVEEVVRGDGVFIGHETTARVMRQQYQQPRVLQRLDRAQWAAAGCPDVVQDALREARRLAAEHTYEVPRELMAELRRYVTAAGRGCSGRCPPGTDRATDRGVERGRDRRPRTWTALPQFAVPLLAA